MVKTIDTIQELNLRINSANVLFFDMDGILVDTNYANYLSYYKAVQQVLKSHIDIYYNPAERFNRAVLKILIPSLTTAEYEKIIQLKNEFYIEHLPETKLIGLAVNILNKYSKTNKTILVTNCQKDRAVVTLKYHGLIDKFSYMFFQCKTSINNKVNKYEIALLNLQIHPDLVFVFENDVSEINQALLAGIPMQNIQTLKI